MAARGRSAAAEDQFLLAEVAHLYYVGDQTQGEIAERIGVSRSAVSRMLKEAREQGMVEIRIHAPLRTHAALGEGLAARLGLRGCLVLAEIDLGPGTFEDADVATRVAALAARYLRENLRAGVTVGLGWGRSVHRVAHSRFLREERDVTVAQAMGSIGGSIAELDGVATTARLASVLGGEAHYLHAPALVADASVREGLLRDPHIARTLQISRGADVAVLSVGTVGREHGQYRTGYLDDADLDEMRRRGVVGEVCSNYFSIDGALVPLEMNDRSISLSAEEMLAVPLRIGVSSGPEKPPANVGAARSALIDVLVTDEGTARGMLGLLQAEEADL